MHLVLLVRQENLLMVHIILDVSHAQLVTINIGLDRLLVLSVQQDNILQD